MAQQESTTVFKISDFFTSAMQKIIATQDKFESKVKSMESKSSGAFDKMQAGVEKFKTKNMEAISGIASEIPYASRALELLSNPYVAAGAAAVAAGGLMFKAASMANEWDSQMAKVNVTLEATPTRLKEVSNQVKSIAANNANAFMDAPKAFDKLVSGGLDYATAIGALDPVLKAAKAGFTDVGVTADAAIGVMNSTGIKDGTKVLDVLIQTLKSGKAEFVDVANYMPKLIPVAKAVGFSFEEAAGSFAFFTAQGFRAEQATTTMENTMRALGKSGVKDAFKKMGIDLYDTQGKMKPLLTTVEALKKKLEKFTPEGRTKLLETLGLDAEASLGMNVMIQNTEKLKKILDASQNSAGALGKAINDAQTPMEVWLILFNKFNDKLTSLGQAMLPTIKAIGKFILDNAEAIKLFGAAVLGAGLAWGSYQVAINAVSWATKAYTAVQWALNAAWEASGVGTIVVAIGALAGGLVYAYNKSETFRAALNGLLEVGKVLTKMFIGLGEVVIGAMTLNPVLIKDGIERTSNAIAKMSSKGIGGIYQEGYNQQMKSEKGKKKESLTPEAPGSKPLGTKNFNGKATAKEGSVSGGGTKSIQITIHNLLPGMVVHATTVKEGAQNIGKLIQEELTKMLADVSLSTANE